VLRAQWWQADHYGCVFILLVLSGLIPSRSFLPTGKKMAQIFYPVGRKE